MELKEIESFKKLKWLNNAIGVNVCTRDTNDIATPEINYHFGFFEKPVTKTDSLYIVLDHSWVYDENTDNVIFIDHHAVEVLFNANYGSNADMMSKNYSMIYNAIKQIITTFRFKTIEIHTHWDIDGVASALIMRKVCIDINNGKIDPHYEIKIKLAKILGNFGDIDPNAALSLIDIMDDDRAVKIYTKKINSFCKTFSRFMKATRPIYPVFNDTDENEYKDYIDRFNRYIKDSGLTVSDIQDVVEKKIFESLTKLNDIDAKSLIYYFNNIATSKVVNKMVEFFNVETDRIISSYISPSKSDSAAFEMFVKFKKDAAGTVFRLLICETEFDAGRTILWKYRSSYAAAARNKKTSQWYYSVTDWDRVKPNVANLDNIACYNSLTGKLSLDGNNNSAFEIGQALGGGGHGDIDGGKRSLGSVIVKDINKLFDEIIIIELF